MKQLEFLFKNHSVNVLSTENQDGNFVKFKIIRSVHPALSRYLGVEYPVGQIKEFGSADFTHVHLSKEDEIFQELMIEAYDEYLKPVSHP